MVAAPADTVIQVDVVIVGAGFSGLGMAIRLQERGDTSFVILEKAASLGGTWRDNDYPGCACDVPSALYSFSFAKTPQSGSWSRAFAPQREILAYLDDTAARFGVKDRVVGNSAVVEAAFDGSHWNVLTSSGQRYRGRHIVFGIGALHRPKIPTLPGQAQFKGTAFHSARWRHDVDLSGKTVAVVGSGASAIQFVPEIAKTAGKLLVFQRTPPWVLPKIDREFSDVERAIRRLVPGVQELSRLWTFLKFESRAVGFVIDPRLMKLLERVARWHIKQQVPDREMRRRLRPHYTPGCKRVLLSNDWYPALQRANVAVVDHGVASFNEAPLRSTLVDDSGAEHAVDVVVYATGFHVSAPFDEVSVVGENGVTLKEAWRDGICAYKGTHVAGFPNLSILMGPNTGLGHSSMILMLESQIALILDELDQLKRRNKHVAEVKADAMQRWNDALQPRLQKTVWASGCSSWYLDDKGRNGTAWPGFTFQFRNQTRRAQLDDLELKP